VCRESQAAPIWADREKLFSALFRFLRFYTARVIRYPAFRLQRIPMSASLIGH
jgi:hypothetical protein